MLAHMTKDTFINAVNERRIIIQNVKGNKYQAFLIKYDDYSGNYNIINIINPKTKDGYFNQNGGGYNKSYDTFLDIAYYIDNNKDLENNGNVKCYEYAMSNQKFITI